MVSLSKMHDWINKAKTLSRLELMRAQSIKNGRISMGVIDGRVHLILRRHKLLKSGMLIEPNIRDGRRNNDRLRRGLGTWK